MRCGPWRRESTAGVVAKVVRWLAELLVCGSDVGGGGGGRREAVVESDVGGGDVLQRALNVYKTYP